MSKDKCKASVKKVKEALKENMATVWPKAKKDFQKAIDKVWPQTKKDLELVASKVWPQTKKELEAAVEQSKKLLTKGEAYIKVLSKKSIKNAKKLSLSLKKEKLYYNLGKSVADIPQENWQSDEKVKSLMGQIQTLAEEIKRIK